MVNPFQLSSIPSIDFGVGSFQRLPSSILSYDKRVLIITGKSSFAEQREVLIERLNQNSIVCFFDVVDMEPGPAIIDRIVQKYAEKEIGVVVAIGGGSVIDAGKAVSAMLLLNEPVKHYLEGVGHKTPTGQKIPFIAIPTTSGTGSETTKNAVISEVGKNGFKKSLRHDNYIPNLAIVDPSLTVGCPPELTSSSGMDALTQLMESYLSTKSTEFTDMLALDGIKKIFGNMVTACHEPENLRARTAMSYAAMLSGITLANAGLGTVHGFASSVGAEYAIPHGIVCGTLMATCNKFALNKIKNEKETPTLSKYVVLGKLATGHSSKSVSYYLDYFIDFLENLTEKLSIPRLSAFGVTENSLSEIADKTGNKNNPIQFNNEELISILNERL